MQKEEYLIKEAAKVVHVESHVLRYWEEELNMPIQRNDKGHRIYSKEDLERFIKVKELKEEGLQLKAVKKILEENDNQNISFKIKNIDDFVKMNTPDRVSQIVKSKVEDMEDDISEESIHKNKPEKNINEIQFIPRMKLDIKEKDTAVEKRDAKNKQKQNKHEVIIDQEHLREMHPIVETEKERKISYESQQEKMIRMQALIKKFITDTVIETHDLMKGSIQQEIKENIAKEIDYQFRCRSELEEELEKSRREREDVRIQALQEQGEKWELERQKREEAHYKNLDELLRKSLKSKKIYIGSEGNEKKKIGEKYDDKSGEQEKREEKALHEKLFQGKRKKLPNH